MVECWNGGVLECFCGFWSFVIRHSSFDREWCSAPLSLCPSDFRTTHYDLIVEQDAGQGLGFFLPALMFQSLARGALVFGRTSFQT
jgi:hypothetical protein